MMEWIEEAWKNYIESLGMQFNSLLIIDYASQHIKEELTHKFQSLDVEYVYIPKVLTHLLQRLDVRINKSMKVALRNKYTEYCIKENYNINTKVSSVKILNWICEDWYDENIITKNMIEKSFIITGISNSIKNQVNLKKQKYSNG